MPKKTGSSRRCDASTPTCAKPTKCKAWGGLTIESGANRFAISNAFRQSRVELSDIVTRVGCDPFRNPAVFAWYGQLGEFLLTTSSPSHIQFLPLHRGS